MATRPQVRRPSVDNNRATYDELLASLQISEHTLETNCVHQPTLYFEIAQLVTAARTEKANIKQELKEKEAEVSNDIRHSAATAGERITVGEVNDQVALDRAIVALNRKLLAADEKLGKLEALKESYQQRKDMLRELVQLYMSNYFADPARSGEARTRDAATEGLRRARREAQGR
jgi:hypothetical protein